MAAITICRSTRASATRRVSRDVAAARGRGENLWSLDRNQSAGPHLKLGRGISRGAPSAAASANQLQAKRKSIEFLTSPGEFSQRQTAKIPEKRDGSYPDGRNPLRTPVSSIRFFIHSTRFLPLEDLLQYTRGTSVPYRDRDATVSGAAAPHLYGALRMRVQTLKTVARVGRGATWSPPRPARGFSPRSYNRRSQSRRVDWTVSPDDTKYLRRERRESRGDPPHARSKSHE